MRPFAWTLAIVLTVLAAWIGSALSRHVNERIVDKDIEPKMTVEWQLSPNQNLQMHDPDQDDVEITTQGLIRLPGDAQPHTVSGTL